MFFRRLSKSLPRLLLDIGKMSGVSRMHGRTHVLCPVSCDQRPFAACRHFSKIVSYTLIGDFFLLKNTPFTS